MPRSTSPATPVPEDVSAPGATPLRRRAAGAAAAAAVALALAAGTVLAAPGGAKVLDASLAAEPASQVNHTLFGVTAGGLPWHIDHGSVQLFANGRLHLEVQGLVLAGGPPNLVGTNPIPNAEAILTCAGMPAATSSVVPFSAAGDASINETITLPASCLAPTVFFAGVPAPNVARWFAVTGW